MASPNSGRRSYSRRAQYSAFAAYVIAVAGVVAGLLSALLWVVDPVGFGNLRIIVSEATAPVARVAGSGIAGIADIDDSLAAWWRAGSQNGELRAKLAQAHERLARAQGLEAENRQLRALLGVASQDVRPVAAGRLLSSSASSTRRYAILDAGHSDGVRSGQPVRSAYGLIGRTLEVGPTVARVLLITDSRSIVPARRASDGLPLLITGRGDDLLDVRTLGNATITLKAGDLLLASGSGGLYHPRTPVARVVRLTRDGALAQPVATPGGAIMVIVEPAADAHLDPLPPPQEEVGP